MKIISISKPKRSILVSMRIRMPRAELLKVSESKTAEVQNQKEVRAKAAATAAAAAITAEKDYEWLFDGQEVHGEVVNILKKTAKAASLMSCISSELAPSSPVSSGKSTCRSSRERVVLASSRSASASRCG